jgi:hypothetical protein
MAWRHSRDIMQTVELILCYRLPQRQNIWTTAGAESSSCRLLEQSTLNIQFTPKRAMFSVGSDAQDELSADAASR